MRLLLVEDDTELANGLRGALQLSGYTVDVFDRGGAALAAAAQAEYEAAILDLGLPDIDGLTVLARLRQRGATWPVVILTARDELRDRIGGLDAGADDYVVKPFAFAELEARLRAVLRRPRAVVGPVVRYGALALETATREVTLDGRLLELPPRELAVLRKLLDRAGRVVAREALFEAVYGWQDDAQEQAIEVYVSRLRKRLEAAGLRIRMLRGLGYRLELADE